MNISSTYPPPVVVPQSTNVAAPTSSPNKSSLIHAVQSLNDAEMFGQENELTFAIDKVARVVVVRLVNKDTREVMEQIPDSLVLQLAEELNTEHVK